MAKKIILVDMDNTIVDYSSEMARQLRIVYGDTTITPENWDIIEYHDLNERRREIQSEPNFFLHLPPIEGALQALKEIAEDPRFELFVVSSPSIHSETCHSDKCMWLLQHCGANFARNLILTKDKTMVYGDVLIDDKPNVSGVKTPTWTLVTFKQPYNTGITGRVYLNRWSDWKQVVQPLCNQ